MSIPLSARRRRNCLPKPRAQTFTGTVAFLFALGALISAPSAELAAGHQGYYRFPALYRDTIVFTAEGDLWEVKTNGGFARRLTSHPGLESHAAFSPDGKTIAFSAEYEGPTEVYSMPVAGGVPVRHTFEDGSAAVVGWTPDGKIIYATGTYSTLPNQQLVRLDPRTDIPERISLSQASDGVFGPGGQTLFFTRLPFQGSSTKRYKGGTAQNLWKFDLNGAEAIPLTADFAGTSKSPMWWNDRVYFVTDRDGTMNIWSMDTAGADLRQHTRHQGWDVKSPSLSEGKIVYQLGADLHLFDIASGQDRMVVIRLVSDFDQEREKWVSKPMDYLTAAHLSPDGDRVVLTARGEIFVAPVKPSRFVAVTRQPSIRYRRGRFLPDGQHLLALSDASGELEWTRLPANGVGHPEPLTSNGKVFRFDGLPSPDGEWIAYSDKNLQLWLFNIEARTTRLVATSAFGEIRDLAWSPDSQWLAYVEPAPNQNDQIHLYNLKTSDTTSLTSERADSYSPAWSPDGKWIYFISDRHFESVVGSPWGPRQPEPFFDKPSLLYQIALQTGQRSPFQPDDELHNAKKKDAKTDEMTKDNKDKKDTEKSAEAKKDSAEKDTSKNGEKDEQQEKSKTPAVAIETAGLPLRQWKLPVSHGNYSDLALNSNRLFWTSRETGPGGNKNLMTLEISNDDPKAKTLVEDIRDFELSQDGKKILVRKGNGFYVIDAKAGPPAKLEKAVDLSGWTFSLRPRDEWRQMFVDSWRLMRDYFYDPHMHGVDWPAVRDKYLPLLARVTNRSELSDLISEMVGELSALHIFVRYGDVREGPDQVKPTSLGAKITRDEKAGGYRIDHIYQSDPDYPDDLSPLARPGLDLQEGDIIEMINGVNTLSVPHPESLLRNQAGQQVLLRVRSPKKDTGQEVIVKPISTGQASDLRYREWEYTRRLLVEKASHHTIGYVHLRAMGRGNIAEWARDFYPIFNRQGLIIDVRHNRGGNIDSWILSRLLRKAWFLWQPRAGQPYWNMPFAFRGPMVVLCNERTASDGEAFTEGFRRLGLGKIIGTRTWGGEVWLSFDNWLVDKGIASAAEIGVYGPEGKWLIEGHGVDPDIVLDNLPHATFEGKDAQLDAALDYLKKQLAENPVTVPAPPPYPDKSVR